jgi:hypothetical protein
LKRGLDAPDHSAESRPAKPGIEIRTNGLPMVRCAANAPAKWMSAAELRLLEQETLNAEDLQRL